MSRPHRRRPLPRPILCPAQEPLSPEERATHLAVLHSAVEGLCAVFAASPLLKGRLSAAQRRTLRGRWAAHLPQLALRLATVLDSEPTALASLGLTGSDLRAQEVEVRLLFAMKTMLDALAERMADALLQGRGALCSDAQRTLDAIEALTQGPLATPEVARRLSTAAEPARTLVRRQREQVRATRQKRKLLRTQVAEAAALEAGAGSDGADQAAEPKSSRLPRPAPAARVLHAPDGAQETPGRKRLRSRRS